MISPGTLRRAVGLIFFPLTILSIFLLVHYFDSIPGFIVFYSSNTKSGQPPNRLYKHPSSEPAPPPIVDNFPLAAAAKAPSELPPIPAWNVPPIPHVKEPTPLFIPFTRNWRLLQQTVVSYLTAGWPPEDIYVVENTGVMHANMLGQLTLQNPFYLDHRRLTEIFGVNVIRAPTLLTFAQLQNFLTYTALEREWQHYFWAHMDSPVLSDEQIPVTQDAPYKSLYTRAVDALRQSLDPAWGDWAARWFQYDRLTLVRTQAYMDVGGWDTLIPFYMTDCDMHERLFMHGFSMEDAAAGKVYDVDQTLDDLALLYDRGMSAAAAPRSVLPSSIKKRDQRGRGSAAVTDDDEDSSPNSISHAPPVWKAEDLGSASYQNLLHAIETLQHRKNANPEGRNTWQSRQRGGQGEPFYRDPDGFEQAMRMWTEDFGRQVYQQKWGRGYCNLREVGIEEGDEWQLINEWEIPSARKKWERERVRLEKERKRKAKEEAANAAQREKVMKAEAERGGTPTQT